MLLLHPPAKGDTMQCAQCARSLPARASFCPTCGGRIAGGQPNARIAARHAFTFAGGVVGPVLASYWHVHDAGVLVVAAVYGVLAGRAIDFARAYCAAQLKR
jgi:hypothetical protein